MKDTFTFWIIKATRTGHYVQDSCDVERKMVFYYEKPCFTDSPSKAKHFRTLRNAQKVSDTLKNIGYETEILEYLAQLTS
jgi:hypothetical protein